MRITMISDTHNKHKGIYLDEGDILIHAGDATGRGMSGEIEPFLKWFGAQRYTYKIFIAGNHDWGFEREPERYEAMCKKYDVIYLNDSGITLKDFDTGEDIKIWGSPVQPTFCNWAFNRDIHPNKEEDRYNGVKRHPWIKPHWDMIPDDTDILITHGPPQGILDAVRNVYRNPHNAEHVGCPHLRDAIFDRIKPKLHVFGHIHDEHGNLNSQGILFVNAAQLNDSYNINYLPEVIKWKGNKPHLK